MSENSAEKRRPETTILTIDFDRLIWPFLILHVVLWTLLGISTQPNPPLDVIEAIAWGQHWQWGYWKHPPLGAWIAAASFNLGGAELFYLTTHLLYALGFYAIWRLGRDVLGALPALIALLLFEGLYYTTFAGLEFNANTVLYPFWGLCVWLYYRAVMAGGGWPVWLALGLCAGLGMLGKYVFAVLLLLLALHFLCAAERRRLLATSGPWITVAVAVLVFLPHLCWMMAHDFITLRYLTARGDELGDLPDIMEHLWLPVSFFLVQILHLILPLILCLMIFGLPKYADLLGRLRESAAQRYVLLVGFAPLLLAVGTGVVFGLELQDMWAAPLLFAAPLALVVLLWSPATMRRLKLFSGVYFVVAALVLLAPIAVNLLSPYITERGKRIHFPGEMLARAHHAAWCAAGFEVPPHILGGDIWLVGNVAVFARKNWPEGTSPLLLIDGALDKSPWIQPDDLTTEALAVFWMSDKRGKRIASLEEAIEKGLIGSDINPDHLSPQPPIILDWQGTAGSLPPVIINWAAQAPQFPHPSHYCDLE